MDEEQPEGGAPEDPVGPAPPEKPAPEDEAPAKSNPKKPEDDPGMDPTEE